VGFSSFRCVEVWLLLFCCSRAVWLLLFCCFVCCRLLGLVQWGYYVLVVFGLLLLFVLPVRLFSFLARLFCWFGSCCFSVFKTTTFAKCIINISLKEGGSFLLRRAAGYHTCLIIFNQFEHFSLYYVAVLFLVPAVLLF
jgi:hypothetical protein